MAEIKNPLIVVQSGGGGGGSTSDDVRFIDYDGTIIAQMSIAEAQALTELPEGPVHDIIAFDGWTHTLEEVNATTRKMDIGATYVSRNDERETIIKVRPGAQNATVAVNFTQDTERGVEIDWGDNTTPETFSGTGATINASHTYASPTFTGDPVYIRILPGKNVALELEVKQSNYIGVLLGECTLSGLGSQNISGGALMYLIVSKYMGTDTIWMQGASVVAVIIPPEVILEKLAMANCAMLQYAVAPKVKELGFVGSAAIRRVIIPDGTLRLYGTSQSMGAFNGCKALKEIVMNEDVQSFDGRCFNQIVLEEITFPTSVTTMPNEMIRSGVMLRMIFKDRSAMPTTGSGAFLATNASFGPIILDFTDCKQVPTLDSAFLGNYTNYYLIHVPASLETQWKAASNWNQYSSIIIGV